MRQAAVLYKGEEAGILSQLDNGSFSFRYHESWLLDDSKPSISLTMPKIFPEHHSSYLFSFFYHMLPEGANRAAVCILSRLEKDDDFGLLMITAAFDTIGAVTIRRIKEGSKN